MAQKDEWVEIVIGDDKEKVMLDGSVSHNDKKLTGDSTFEELLTYLKEGKKYEDISPLSWVLLEWSGEKEGLKSLPLSFPNKETISSRKAFGHTIEASFPTQAVMSTIVQLYTAVQMAGIYDLGERGDCLGYYMTNFGYGAIETANKQAEMDAKKDGKDGKEDEEVDPSQWKQYITYLQVSQKQQELSSKMNELQKKGDAAKTFEEARDAYYEYWKLNTEQELLDDINYSKWQPIGDVDKEAKWRHNFWEEMRKFEREASFWRSLRYAMQRNNFKPKDPNGFSINVPPIPEQKYTDSQEFVLPQRPDMVTCKIDKIREYSDAIREKYTKFLEPSLEDAMNGLQAWNNFKYALYNDPFKLSSDVSVGLYAKALSSDAQRLLAAKYKKRDESKNDKDDEKQEWTKYFKDEYTETYAMQAKARELVEKGIKNKEVTMHPYLFYVASREFYYHPGEAAQRRNELCKEIFNDLKKYLNKMKETQKPLPKKDKEYAKWLLVWNWKGMGYDGDDYFEKLRKIAVELMDVLSKPLVDEYKKLEAKNSPIIGIKLTDQYKCDSSIKNNNDLLSFMWSSWYTNPQETLSDDEINSIVTDYQGWGFCNNGKAEDIKQHLLTLRVTTHQLVKQCLQTKAVIMDMINEVAAKVDPVFQATMKRLYEANLKQCDWLKNDDNNKNKLECGVFAGPIKTKARQEVKITYDYKHEKAPRAGCVLDDVRCAIVCTDDIEMASLYKLILKEYEKKVFRVKNAFSDVNKANYGYRAVLINVIQSVQINGTEFPMIVEIQLILAKYFDVRKSMHLAYSIVRADNADTLAMDACKVGKLDI